LVGLRLHLTAKVEAFLEKYQLSPLESISFYSFRAQRGIIVIALLITSIGFESNAICTPDVQMALDDMP
jgi:hypothetical protein